MSSELKDRLGGLAAWIIFGLFYKGWCLIEDLVFTYRYKEVARC